MESELRIQTFTLPTASEVSFSCGCICTITGLPCGDIAEYKLAGIPLCGKHSFVYSSGNNSPKRQKIVFPSSSPIEKPTESIGILSMILLVLKYVLNIFGIRW